MIKTIEVSDTVIALCNVTSKLASEMSIDEASSLLNWCSYQDSSLWEGMSLQEILNVYRVSAVWLNWEAWAEEDWEAAYEAWNSAVIDPKNKLIPRSE